MSQQQQHKFYPCRRGCGTQVTFDNAFRSRDGTKMVPLVFNPLNQLETHQCPNYVKGQQQEKSTSHQSGSTLSAPTSNNSNDLATKEVAEIKARLLIILDRLSTLEKELQK